MPEEREIEIVGVGVGWVGVGVVGGGGCGGLGLVVVLGVRWGEVGGIKPPPPPQTLPLWSLAAAPTMKHLSASMPPSTLVLCCCVLLAEESISPLLLNEKRTCGCEILPLGLGEVVEMNFHCSISDYRLGFQPSTIRLPVFDSQYSITAVNFGQNR